MHNIKDLAERVWPITIISAILVLGFIVYRIVSITHEAKISYCPNKNDTEVVNYFAVPFIQSAVTCESN